MTNHQDVLKASNIQLCCAILLSLLFKQVEDEHQILHYLLHYFFSLSLSLTQSFSLSSVAMPDPTSQSTSSQHWWAGPSSDPLLKWATLRLRWGSHTHLHSTFCLVRWSIWSLLENIVYWRILKSNVQNLSSLVVLKKAFILSCLTFFLYLRSFLLVLHMVK